MKHTINPSNSELQNINSNTTIYGLKLTLNCKCGRKWAIWFKDLEDLEQTLPENWHICSACKKNNMNNLGGE